MNDLTTRDIKDVMAAVERLGDGADFTERVLCAVTHVIPNDLTAVDRFSAGEQEEYFPVHWNNNAEMLTPAVEEVCSAVFEQNPRDNPLVEELVFNGNNGVMKLSDFGEQARFRETAYYNEVMRSVGFDRQMAVMIAASPGTAFSFAINRKGPDFSERERQKLRLLQPYLKSVIALENERRRYEDERLWMEKALETAGVGAVTFSAAGRVLRAAGQARELVRRYFPEAGDDMAAVLAASQQAPGNISSGAGLRIETSVDPVSRSVTLVLTEAPRLDPAMLESLGLTPRQAEVLYWIAEGKTDEVIADLTGMSRRTVHKHVENILARLAVETRTAAAGIAFSLLG